MAYTEKVWEVNDPILAEDLNNIENGIVEAYEMQNRSLNEIVIGTWIDGKPIYRKVMSLGLLPNTMSVALVHNITDVDLFVRLYGFAYNSSGATMPLPYPHTETLSSQVTISADKTSVMIGTGSDRSAFTAYAVLEYTKTTD